VGNAAVQVDVTAQEDYEHKLTERTLYLVVCYSPGISGEWWDNKSGQNYKIGFRRASASHSLNFSSMGFGAIGSGSSGQAISHKRTSSAPCTLRSTPITGEPRRAGRTWGEGEDECALTGGQLV